jgi:hypothetical protein
MKKIVLPYELEQMIFGLDESAVGRLFKAMIFYSLYKKEMELKGWEQYVWPLAKLYVDRGETVYEEE